MESSMESIMNCTATCVCPLAAVALVAGVGIVAAPALVTAPILAAVGFTPGGVLARSAAAAAQSGIGNVAAGSAFAVCQSAAAGGYGALVVNGAVQAAGVGIAAISGFFVTKSEEKE
ncbi:hypothetical protein LLEC1_05681 [Akanthomyces lecanii]|uniref:Uncharacterized protein n=1 Tax=Cordyceps confragosa TaxID=2714763 RepID=A0A179IH45_CORDF|nr:hypothetical protein LLEC1_05681 [Akanthomyces lecanii]